jgi:hypothetical protein
LVTSVKILQSGEVENIGYISKVFIVQMKLWWAKRRELTGFNWIEVVLKKLNLYGVYP